MRTRMLILTGALLVASASYAQAQDAKPAAPATKAAAPAAKTAATSFTPNLGNIDFGYRGTSLTGDEARYNRYRDLRDGPYVDRFRFARENETTAFRAEARNVDELGKLVVANVQNISGITRTLTCPVVHI